MIKISQELFKLMENAKTAEELIRIAGGLGWEGQWFYFDPPSK